MYYKEQNDQSASLQCQVHRGMPFQTKELWSQDHDSTLKHVRLRNWKDNSLISLELNNWGESSIIMQAWNHIKQLKLFWSSWDGFWFMIRERRIWEWCRKSSLTLTILIVAWLLMILARIICSYIDFHVQNNSQLIVYQTQQAQKSPSKLYKQQLWSSSSNGYLDQDKEKRMRSISPRLSPSKLPLMILASLMASLSIDAFKNKTMSTLDDAGFNSILDKTKPIKDQEGNHRVYYLFDGATNDGSASHIVRGHKEERDGRAAWYA